MRAALPHPVGSGRRPRTVAAQGARAGRLRSIDSALRFAPVERVDYVWLIDTGLPRNPDPRLRLVWQQGRSLLFAVRPLTLPKWQVQDL